MKLRYQNTLEDFVAFGRHFHEHSVVFKRQCLFVAAFIFVVVFINVLFVYFQIVMHVMPNPGEPRPAWLSALTLALGLVLATGLGVLGFWLWRPFALFLLERNVRRIYQHNTDKVALAEQELELVPGWLINRHCYGESRLLLTAIEDISETPRHVFLRLSAIRAYVLPRDAFDDEELHAFLDELERADRHPPPQEMERQGEPSDAIQVRPGRDGPQGS